MYDLIGKSLGKYHIIELIDETAGTEIYKGFNPAINRYVVINVLKQAFLNNDAVLRRFLAQNDIAAKIHHPHIAQFFDFGVENGIHYRVFLYGVNGRLQDNKHWFNQREPMLGLVSDLSSAGMSLGRSRPSGARARWSMAVSRAWLVASSRVAASSQC